MGEVISTHFDSTEGGGDVVEGVGGDAEGVFPTESRAVGTTGDDTNCEFTPVAVNSLSTGGIGLEMSEISLRTVSSKSALLSVSSEILVLSRSASSSRSWFKSSCTVGMSPLNLQSIKI